MSESNVSEVDESLDKLLEAWRKDDQERRQLDKTVRRILELLRDAGVVVVDPASGVRSLIGRLHRERGQGVEFRKRLRRELGGLAALWEARSANDQSLGASRSLLMAAQELRSVMRGAGLSDDEPAASEVASEPDLPPVVAELLRRACRGHGSEDTFNLANLSHVVTNVFGLRGPIDGGWLRLALRSFPQVEQLPVGYYRVRRWPHAEAGL